MTNYLTKNFTITTVQPDSYQQWIPGYSYFKDSIQAELTTIGKNYVSAVVRNQGFNVTSENISNYIFAIFYRSNPEYQFDNLGNPLLRPVGWYIQFEYTPKIVGQIALPTTLHTTVNTYFDVPPEGMMINVPGSYTTITTEPYEQQVPIVGWNAGAISESMFTSTGTSSFSVETNSVGVFTGLCEQSIAIQDQRPERIKYAIYTHLGIGSVYVDNVKKITDFSYTRDDVFKIVISKYLVSFYMNGLLIYSETKEDSNTIYVLDCSMYYSNDTIINASINSLGVLDSYSSITSNQIHSGNIISNNYSSISGSEEHSCMLGVYPKLTFENKHNTTLISFNYSAIGSEQAHTTNLLSYPSRIESNQLHDCILLSKYGSIISGSIAHSSLLEAGGVIPTIPPNIISTQLHTGFMRNVFILPPQVFIIT